LESLKILCDVFSFKHFLKYLYYFSGCMYFSITVWFNLQLYLCSIDKFIAGIDSNPQDELVNLLCGVPVSDPLRQFLENSLSEGVWSFLIFILLFEMTQWSHMLCLVFSQKMHEWMLAGIKTISKEHWFYW